MTRKYNFSPGPAMLPLAVLERAQAELVEWQDTGSSVMEVSHRTEKYMQLAMDSENRLRALLNIPDDYAVLFLHGGATTQFASVPLNLLGRNPKSGYIVTGHWSKKAYKEAQIFSKPQLIAETQIENELSATPLLSMTDVPNDLTYLYYTSNETIHGIQYHDLPVDTAVPLACDMTSSIMAEPIDVKRYAVFFASAQKNLGQAGVTIVVVRKDMVGHPLNGMPSLFDYTMQIERTSMWNTPPTYAWYMCDLMLQWIEQQGGIPAMQQQTKAKADLIYQCIDENPKFYNNPVHKDSRSLLNVPFQLPSETLNTLFLKEAETHDLTGLKGHRIVGGIRASMYLGMPMAGAQTLADFMRDFIKRKG